MFYVMNSLKPEYNQRIIHAFLLAPAGYMSHSELAKSIPASLAPAILKGMEVCCLNFTSGPRTLC